jgi:hypothetical protein
VKAESTQLVAAFTAFPLTILFFSAKCFTRIHKMAHGGYAEGRKCAKIAAMAAAAEAISW